jgi:lipoprotein-releasing system ATP-binding protein
MLQVKNINKSFYQRGLVLDNLTLDVKEADSIAISGPSGSGKTTLMNIIGLLDRPDSGEIFFRNRSLTSLNDNDSAIYRNRNIGFVFQEHFLMSHLTVMENILVPLLASRTGKNEWNEKRTYIDDLIQRTGIDGLKDKYPFQISGGEAQRVTLVRALVNKPSILLADEPTGSLDARNAEILGDLLVKMNRESGITLIVATHSMELAGKMAIRLKLDNGILRNLN